MDFDQHTYEKIEQYLAGELKGEVLQKFEKELKANIALSREVKLTKEMNQLLADTPENSLRKNLQFLSDQIQEDPNKSGNSFKFLFLLIPLFLLAGWWMLQPNDPTPTPPPSSNKPTLDTTTIKIPSTETSPPQIEADINPPTEKKPETKERKEEKEIAPVKEKAKEKPVKEPDYAVNEKPDSDKDKETPFLQTEPPNVRVYSSASSSYMAYEPPAEFQQNSDLEFLIDNNVRNNDVQLEIATTMDQVNLPNLSDPVNFRIAGTFTSKEDLSKKDFKVHLFPNDKSVYKNFFPMYTGDLNLEATEKDVFTFDFQKYILLKPGLYYYLLEDLAFERVYFVQKFEVYEE